MSPSFIASSYSEERVRVNASGLTPARRSRSTRFGPMPYVEGRTVHDADSHVMETPDWLVAVRRSRACASA